ncbi:glutamate-cysteine ligase family protein [Thiohalobacter sp. IOR34]|uniref:glutamate-cysteine ligase family protein n=1 Tax=Thiohalobacter sp. IOR34 TaxID=3057176 RepID=UPI0025AFC8CA|nr:glutamate-cysteine ligase family protein [Thiohalobacter sp. IOR34]WJW75917.1 glutamate-cysteine ligase family protein [Thiohalobacter sp. IOR34]
MGEEIRDSHFTAQDLVLFRERLAAETGRLRRFFEQHALSTRDGIGGYELEAWLVDAGQRPAPCNAEFLERLRDPLVVPELARFNVELNSQPRPLQSDALARMQDELQATWDRCRRCADEMGLGMVMIGILPTLEEGQLGLGSMSGLSRYRALNEQVLAQRGGRPLRLDILGEDHLRAEHQDVMLESATTSFQIHLQAAPQRAVRLYNAAQILSAPMVAACANSPFLFGHELWDETRIPLFEQAVEVGGYAGAAQGPVQRVSFGSGYARDSLFECFEENLLHFPVLLPVLFERDDPSLPHLRLHNGTIWRWNRPLLGFDADGTPHLRIEHRVVPSGPSVVDTLANAAFFFGLMKHYAECPEPPERQLDFPRARDNFYRAARHGLEAQVEWLDGRKGRMQSLLLKRLIPEARQGLARLQLDAADIEFYLGSIEARVANACNGAAWQRAWVARHGRDWVGLTAAYRERQDSGRPVHEWDI